LVYPCTGALLPVAPAIDTATAARLIVLRAPLRWLGVLPVRPMLFG
jgi:hypothetical protein